MPFTVGWYDSGILVDCTDTLDSEAPERLLKVVRNTLDRCEFPINIILDWRGSHGDPVRRYDCTNRVAALGHPRLRMVIAVDHDPVANIWTDPRLACQDCLYRVCGSLEEAMYHFRQYEDTSRPVLSPCPECP